MACSICSDELKGPRDLGAWMSQRGLLCRRQKPRDVDTALRFD